MLVHSLLTGPEAFDRVAGVLAGRFTVHRIHLPGFGDSTRLDRDEVSIADLARVVAATVAGLGCGPDTTVLGNGLGSFVALSLAIEHGDLFHALIASNTGRGFSGDRKGAFLTMSELAESGGMSAVADVAIARIFPPDFHDAHPEAWEERRRVLLTIDPSAFAAACRALSNLDLGDRLHEIENPSLVVAGEVDQTTPPEMGREVASRIRTSRFVVIAGSGHCPQIEQPERLLGEIDAFMADVA